jgi:hypothetical protein
MHVLHPMTPEEARQFKFTVADILFRSAHTYVSKTERYVCTIHSSKLFRGGVLWSTLEPVFNVKTP